MALRLSEPDDSAPSVAPIARPASPWVGVVREAQVALDAGDFRAWHTCVRRASEFEGHDPYRIRRHCLEAGLEHAGQCPTPIVPDLYVTLARATVEALEEEPREPMLLNYAGVAFYELGSLVAAERLFAATERLDSEIPHVQGNLEAVRRRRRRGQGRPPLPKAVAAALPELGKRAEQIAARAIPAAGLTLSLCMIVKDEEEMLPACLEAIADSVDELIVVDTGSSDRTAEIARSHGAKVIDFDWTGSFADARNVSFDAASGDWIMYLDADEVLVADDAASLRELTGQVWREAFYLVETNHTGDLDDGMAVTHNALRVFRNRPRYRFEGRIHEQIAHHLPSDLAERMGMTRIRVEHYGYLGAVRDSKSKSRRNIELLRKQVEEGDQSPFVAFNLGSEYAAAGDATAALAEFKRSWKALLEVESFASRGFAPSLISRLVKAMRFEGEFDAADSHAEQGLRIFPGFTDLVYEQGLVARDGGDTAMAVTLLERCLEMGDAPSAYSATVGCGSYLALASLADLKPAAQARPLLERCLDEHPSFLGAVLPLAAAMLDSGEAPAAAIELVETRVRSVNPSVRFMLGTALYERGHAAEAEAQFRDVLERQPDSGPVLLALAECMLTLGRNREAAEVARLVSDDAPAVAVAVRAQAFAALVEGDAGAADEALHRGRRLGIPAHDLLVLEAWLATARGEEPPAQLPTAAVDTLGSILEALLRVEQVDVFASLVGLVDRTAMSWRERRELLASMYLRRGFLDSAADEWIAVCDESLDARALVGLTQVALAKGLADDARAFAEEAVSIAPTDPTALAAARAAGV